MRQKLNKGVLYMIRTDKKIKSSKRNFIFALILLLSTNIIMGAVIMTMSKNSLKEEINQHILDIANTAAYQLRGDDMKVIKAEDKGTLKYDRALDTLRSFQYNIEMKYIYGIREEEDGSFTFTIDPDPKDPGEFGSPIETTDALKSAAKGHAQVDMDAHSDKWGRFYTAYSPIFDSEGKVAGIVGVDFDADWYDAKLNSNKAVAVILTMAALTIGIVLSFIIMSQNRKRFMEMLHNLSELDRETQKLDNIIMKSSIKKLDFLPNSESKLLKTLASGEAGKKTPHNEYDEMSTSIENVYKKLNKYLRFIDQEVYTDNLTGVSNKAAYRKKVNSISEKIKNGTADFSIAYFDINEITNIYTFYGYEAGDMVMFECGKVLRDVFGKENVYHITSDEYIVIIEGEEVKNMEQKLKEFDKGIESYNKEHEKQNRISVAKGCIIFDKEKYPDYRNSFIEAKKLCDKDKAEYFKRKTQPLD